MVLHYPDVYKHPGSVVLSVPSKLSPLFLGSAGTHRKAQKATEVDFENSSKLEKYGTWHAWVPVWGVAMQLPLAH